MSVVASRKRALHATRLRLVAGEWTNAFVGSARRESPRVSTGPLSGWKIAMKDNICSTSFPTTCSSAMLRDFEPEYNATVVSQLEEAGATILGKTNCDEFGMGSTNEYSVWGPVRNPCGVSEERVAGGSSGGSAAAVAGSLCDAALGTDTGGSVRLPASYCGIVGFKPTYGYLSRHGVIAFADSLDCVGVLARELAVVRQMLKILSKHDELDPTSVPEPFRDNAVTSWRSTVPQPPSFRGLSVGIPQEYFPQELDSQILQEFSAVVQVLKRRGVKFRPVSLPYTKPALSAYYIIANAEASSNLARFDGIRYGKGYHDRVFSNDAGTFSHSRNLLGPEVRRRIMLGTYSLVADSFDNYFLQALRVRRAVIRDFDAAFRVPSWREGKPQNHGTGDVDIIMHPTATRTAPRLGDTTGKRVELDSYVQDVMTVPASLAGLPAVSLPTGLGKDGWPLGTSIVGQWGTDELVLEVAALVEHALRS